MFNLKLNFFENIFNLSDIVDMIYSLPFAEIPLSKNSNWQQLDMLNNLNIVNFRTNPLLKISFQGQMIHLNHIFEISDIEPNTPISLILCAIPNNSKGLVWMELYMIIGRDVIGVLIIAKLFKYFILSREVFSHLANRRGGQNFFQNSVNGGEGGRKSTFYNGKIYFNL